ncbi:MAG: CCA tRNA nucleotidyltransferase [Phycisphaerae bacterium]|nr:CCA tRNA nucleotidyltransferase [Phycisphaerae bacterium]
MRKRDWTIEDAALAVIGTLREHGHQALWAGGCVRDMLLGHPPHDIDVATDAPPPVICRLFPKTRKVGVQFGVVLVRQGPHWIETATFRTDLDYRDGRRPAQVVFTTAEQDARRRDFTMNGLFYDPVGKHVIDYVDGRRDIEAGIVRAIGDPEARFAEDHLRMLRAVRFATRFGFSIDPMTAGAICRLAERIRRISPERVREELEKMLVGSSRGHSVRLIAEVGLLPHLWPGSDWSSDRLDEAVRTLDALPEDADFVLSLASLLDRESHREAEGVAQALRCSNDQIEDVAWLVANRRRLADVEAMDSASFKKLAAHRRFSALLALHRAACKARHEPLTASEAARRRLEAIPPGQIAPPPLTTGQDLIDLGLEPGPRFKAILDQLYDAQLNGLIRDRVQALAHLGGIIRRGSGR